MHRRRVVRRRVPAPQITFTDDKISAASFPYDNRDLPRPVRGLNWLAVPAGLVVITGENGVGKTHLLHQLAQGIRSESIVRRRQGRRHINVLEISHRFDPGQTNDLSVRENVAEYLEVILRGFNRRNERNRRQRNINQQARQFIRFIRGQEPRQTQEIDLNSLFSRKIRRDLLGYYQRINSQPGNNHQILKDTALCMIKYPMLVGDIFLTETSAESIFRNLCNCLFARYSAAKNALLMCDVETILRHFPDYQEYREGLDAEGHHFSEVARRCRERIIEEELGEHPVDRINQDLIVVNFPYRFEFNNDTGVNDFYFTKARQNGGRERVEIERFSSGELMMLTVIALKCRNYIITGTQTKQILILDEMDKHFGPKLLKPFMDTIRLLTSGDYAAQIFMSTHRLDTIAQAREGEIFTMRRVNRQNREIPLVKRSTKLLALARLTRNLNGFLGQKTRVYVEGVEDAEFYESFYLVLKLYSAYFRDLRKKEERGLAQNESRISCLSKRYQMEFYSSENHEFRGGGDTWVARLVDRTSKHVLYDNQQAGVAVPARMNRGAIPLYNMNLFKEYRVDGTFGLVDGDYQIGEPLENRVHVRDVSDEVKQDRLVALRRHSLECFIFDPVLICSLFANRIEIERFFTGVNRVDALDNLRIQLLALREGRANNWADALSAVYRVMCDSILALESVQIRHIEEELRNGILDKIRARQRREQNYNLFIQGLGEQEVTDRISAVIAPFVNLPWQATYVMLEGRYYVRSPAETQLYADLLQNLRQLRMSFTNRSETGFFNCFEQVLSNHQLKVPSDNSQQVYDVIADDRDNGFANLDSDNLTYYYFHSSGEVRHMQLQYPRPLLRLRGHDIANAMIFNLDRQAQFQAWVNTRLEELGMADDSLPGVFLPFDLINKYLELNGRVKTQIVAVADPDKLAGYTHAQARQKGFFVSAVAARSSMFNRQPPRQVRRRVVNRRL